jgi:CRP/FNR family nitrogen fixation transcriptional regulator
MPVKSNEIRIKDSSGRPIVDSIADQFGAVISRAGLASTEFSYRKRQEVYGEGEPAEYVCQILSGTARSYKQLADGRGQIGAFLCAG